jgi:hypothetical protein
MNYPVPASPDAGRNWFARLGLSIDRVLNVVLFDGDDTWTVSLHAAVADQAGERWGCIVCWILATLVQRNHCALTLDPTTVETAGAAVRAGLVMILVIGAIWFTLDYFGDDIGRLLSHLL